MNRTRIVNGGYGGKLQNGLEILTQILHIGTHVGEEGVGLDNRLIVCSNIGIIN